MIKSVTLKKSPELSANEHLQDFHIFALLNVDQIVVGYQITFLHI